MHVGILTITLYLPGCHSLKDKRRCIKPIINRLHKEFNISVAEVDHHDVWQSTQLLVTCGTCEGQQAEKTLASVVRFIENHWPDTTLTDENIEIIHY